MQKSESRIQAEIFRWYHNSFCLSSCSPRQMIYHIPNQRGHHLTSIGLYPGVSDLICIHNGIIHHVEVKEPLKGIQSENQCIFEAHCIQSGLSYDIVRSLEEFKILIALWK